MYIKEHSGKKEENHLFKFFCFCTFQTSVNRKQSNIKYQKIQLKKNIFPTATVVATTTTKQSTK